MFPTDVYQGITSFSNHSLEHISTTAYLRIQSLISSTLGVYTMFGFSPEYAAFGGATTARRGGYRDAGAKRDYGGGVAGTGWRLHRRHPQQH